MKERILDGVLPGGELVSENQLAGELQMSRTPVREAFLRLEAEGLMRLYPKRGALVVPVAEGEAIEVVRARHLIEVDAVDQLPGDTADLAEQLSSIIERQSTAINHHDMAAFALADADFHRAIVTAGGNRILDGFYASLSDRQRRMTSRAARRSPQRIAAIIAEHRGLAELAVAGDADGYATALWQHISLTHSLPNTRMPGSRPSHSHPAGGLS